MIKNIKYKQFLYKRLLKMKEKYKVEKLSTSE